MTLAPEMFDEKHALGALRLADQVLRGPLGMKTLDPKDLQYRPTYDNSNDSSDPAIGKGRNYHNVSCVENEHGRILMTIFRDLSGGGHWGIS